jgi:hypothetical protein
MAKQTLYELRSYKERHGSVPKTTVTMKALEAKHASCKNCASFKRERCELKRKAVNHYNICTHWKETA